MSSIISQLQKVLSLPQKMLCIPPCTENIINYFAFSPPSPTYRLVYNDKLSKYQCIFEKPSEYFNTSCINKEVDFCLVKTKYHSNIACVYCPSSRSKSTILYSHGNSCDLGSVTLLCVYLARTFNCNVFSYDYSGYGCSSGRPSERQVYADIEAAALYLTHHYGLCLKDIVLYGHSLGCAPTLDLASRMNVRGVVVQSGFTSAIGVPFPKLKVKRWDQFRNIDKIARVSAPTLLIHGKEDQIVNISHGFELYYNCRTAVEPLWIEGGRHDNIESFDVFFERLQSFLETELPVRHHCQSHTCTLLSQRSQTPFQHRDESQRKCRHKTH